MIHIFQNYSFRKLMANKIEPAPEGSASSALALLKLLEGYVKSKACYHPAALENAKVVNMDQGCGAYQIDLWTLVEHRELKQMHKPYNGEATPGQPPAEKWTYPFPQPPTVLNDKHKEVSDIEPTRQRVVCSRCGGDGRATCHSCKGQVGRPCHYCKNRHGPAHHQPCTHCHGSHVISCSACRNTGVITCSNCQGHGQLLQWYRVTAEWHTKHSTTYQTNTALPAKVIKKAPGKQSYWSIDQQWSYTEPFDNVFREAFDKQNTPYPVKLIGISEDFNKKHLRKVDDDAQIIQIKWDIKKLDIFEIEYELEGYENKKNPYAGES